MCFPTSIVNLVHNKPFNFRSVIAGKFQSMHQSPSPQHRVSKVQFNMIKSQNPFLCFPVSHMIDKFRVLSRNKNLNTTYSTNLH